MSHIVVRLANEQDFDSVCRLRQEVGYTHAKAEPDIFIEERLLDEESFARELNERVVFVAQIDARCVGVCTCTILTTDRFPGMRSRKLCRINTIAVDAGYRRQGVGRVLYEAAIEMAHENECETVQLNVWAFNEDAAAFYRSLDMRCVSHRFEQDV